MARCGVVVDNDVEQKIIEYEKISDREVFKKKLAGLVLRKLLPKGIGKYELAELLKKLSTGEPDDDWLFYYDHNGLHER